MADSKGQPTRRELAAELAGKVRGRVLTGRRRIRARSTDFGRIIRRPPRLVVEATCEDDVVATLKLARANRIPVGVQGPGGSCNGQALCGEGILIRNVLDRPPALRWLDGDRVEIPARSRWLFVETALNRRGRSVPVLADSLLLSVGGTLSVGGYGVSSITRGAQVDHVQRLRLIQPDGTALWCSPESNPELFRYGLAGLGQVGVIEKAVIDTKPHRWLTTLFRYRHRSFSELTGSLEWMTSWQGEWPDFFLALHARNRFYSVYGSYSASLRAARRVELPPPLRRRPGATRWICPQYRLWRSLEIAAWVARFGNRRRLWSDYLLSYEGLVEFLQFLDLELRRDTFSGCLKSVYMLAVRQPADRPVLPFEAAGGIDRPIKFGVGLYSMIPPADAGALDRVQQAVGRCLDKCIELGGRPYLYGWHHLGADRLRALYGASYDRLLELRKKLDPDGLFQRRKLLGDPSEATGGRYQDTDA